MRHIRVILFLIISILLAGCDNPNKSVANDGNYSIQFNNEIGNLPKLIDLNGLEIDSVKWATGSIIQENAQGTLLPSSNDWWLDALIKIKKGQNIYEVTNNCELLYTVSSNNTKLIDPTVKKLTENTSFTQNSALKVFDACRFKSGILANGVMMLDAVQNEILIKMYTN